MKVEIDATRCQGHGMCLLACPEVFALSEEDGHGYVLMEEVPRDLELAVEKARASCPEQAISLE